MTMHPEDTSNQRRREHELVNVVEDAHTEALDALDAERALDAIAWMSAHLAATRRTLHRHAGKDHAVGQGLASQHDVDARLESVLRMAERHVSGDALAANLDAERLADALRDAIADHARIERAWLTALVDSSTEETHAVLLASYTDALAHAPTRPHPHAPHDGLLGVAAFHVDALRDRVLDTLDARHVPTPRPRRKRRTPGPWGNYFLGGMEDQK